MNDHQLWQAAGRCWNVRLHASICTSGSGSMTQVGSMPLPATACILADGRVSTGWGADEQRLCAPSVHVHAGSSDHTGAVSCA